jgi:hypothetical protein
MKSTAPIARAIPCIDNQKIDPLQADKIDMKKPNVRGPSPSRKAHLALREKLNRKSKPPPSLPAKSLDKARSFRRNNLAQHEQ